MHHAISSISKKRFNLIKRLLDAGQRRFVRSRSGSVLILVIALLVLLALIGTAFITMTGADRIASAQHKDNTRIDLLIQGVKELVIARLAAKVSPGDPPVDPTAPPAVLPPTTFRPSLPSTRQAVQDALPFDKLNPSKEYSNIDYAPWDAVLASRYPEKPAMAGAAPNWPMISTSPLALSRHPSDAAYFPDQFQSPYVKAGGSPATSSPATYGSRANATPYFVDILYPNGVTRRYPALGIGNTPPPTGADPAGGMVALAADTDADGIADAGLFDLKLGQIDGIRYYGAIRVIDNSAAINASIAMRAMLPSDGQNANLPTNVFPTNIDLAAIAMPPETAGTNPNAGADPAAFDKFNTYRFGAAGMSLGGGYFNYATQYDAFWGQLGSRLDNPGQNGGNAMRALGLGESAVLASRFCLADPSGPQSVMDKFFASAMRMPSVSRLPFDPGAAFASPSGPPGPYWFDSIFDYETLSAANTPLRPLVVGHNSVTNFVPSFLGDPRAPIDETFKQGKYQYRGQWPDTATTPPPDYHVGDWVRSIDFTNTGPLPRAYVCIRNHQWIKRDDANSQPPCFDGVNPTGAPKPRGPNFAYWAEVPWYSHPVKTNINTASFGELYAAFNAVMGDAPIARPTGVVDDPDRGTGTPHNDYWSFGNVLRPVVGDTPGMPRKLDPYLVRQLRAAIAAVNTIDLRDQDEDVTSRTVALTDLAGTVVHTAQVFGSERQPYITESVVHLAKNDITKRYVMLELFNPHPYEIKLKGFGLYWRSRDPGDTTDGTGMQPVIAIGGALAAKTIPAYGTIYVESFRDRRPLDLQANAPMVAILDDTNRTVQTAELDKVFGNGGTRELFLLRTRRYDGFRTSTLPDNRGNIFNEDGNDNNLIAVDQLEYFGLLPGQSALDPLVEVDVRYHYRRATAPAWHCVYSGPYNPSPTGERRQRGWIQQRPADETMPEFTLPGIGITKAASVATLPQTVTGVPSVPNNASTFRTRQLQVNQSGAAGPRKPRMPGAEGDAAPTLPVMATPVFPYGGFARAGDIMQVTFCGSYRLTDGTIPAAVPEYNPISMDSAFADDGDSGDDVDTVTNGPLEQLGRFCPIDNNGSIRDLLHPPVSPRVAWAKDLFEYFTVMSPQDDYGPNVDPSVYSEDPNFTSGDPTVIGSAPKWPAQATPPGAARWPMNPNPTPILPVPIANGLKIRNALLANRGREDVGAIHGLINVNTANWKVLSAIPFTDVPNDNVVIAKGIVAYRDKTPDGKPFRNLFDLMNVPEVMALQTSLNGINPTNAQGDITPLTADMGLEDDRSIGDFEARFLVINRISNMVTFRSDSFTVYVMVQGWRNAGTSTPELVTQRRAAFILDRSTVLPVIPPEPAVGVAWPGVTLTQPSITNVPQN